MKVKYVGTHDSVLIPEASFGVVKRGETIEVPEDVGRSLIHQGAELNAAGHPKGPGTEWEEVKSPADKKADAKP